MASPNSSAHFETSRIDNYPDKKTLEDIKAYFKTFAEHDFQGMYEMQAEDYTMTDIRTSFPLTLSPPFRPCRLLPFP